MKSCTAILLLVLLSLAAKAQRYKDIFPEIANASTNEEALSLIKTYMIEDLDHPNANLRLALIYESRYRTADPLTQYERAMANAEESALRYLKCMSLVDEKEVKKNTGWYANFSSAIDSKGRVVVEYADVKQKIKNGYDSARLFVEKLPPIYEAFTKSVDFYDQAIKLFAEINGSYTSLDRLLLLYNENLDEKLETLKVQYDSSLYYLDNYLSLIQQYPIKGYHQKYTVHPIYTYRLEGLLTSPNFLANDITIWNYKAWATKVHHTVLTEVSKLRASLEKAENKLNSSIQLIENKSYNENFEPYVIDKKLEFDLRKFDGESLPVALLKYKEFKQNLLMKYYTTQDFDTTLSSEIHDAYYGELIYLAKDADSLLSIVNSRVNNESLEKYPYYLETYYNNQQGVNQYVAKETQTAKNYLAQSVESIREDVLGKLTANKNEPEYYAYRGLKIPSATEEIIVDSLDNNLHTIQKQESADGSRYLSGYVKSSRAPNPVKAFVTKVNEVDKVEWYNEYELIEQPQGSQYNIPGSMTITPEGCAISIFSHDQAQVVNNIVYLNEKGEVLFTKALETRAFPRKSQYVQKNSAMLFAFKGDSIEQNLKAKEPLEMVSINLIGDKLWGKSFAYAGNMEALITTSLGFMIVGNFSNITNSKGEEIVTRINTGQTNAFVAAFGQQGNLKSVMTLKSPDQYVINKVIKVNDRIINLMGYRDPSGKSIHCIINQNNQVVYSNL